MITIRRFVGSDIRSVMGIERQSFGRFAWPRGLLEEYARVCPETFYVARSGDRIVGYAIAGVRPRSVEVVSIAVAARFRRHGIAGRLMRRIIRVAQRAGVPYLVLTVRLDNQAAIAMYRNLGFRRTHTLAGYYEDGAPAWRMVAEVGRFSLPGSM